MLVQSLQTAESVVPSPLMPLVGAPQIGHSNRFLFINKKARTGRALHCWLLPDLTSRQTGIEFQAARFAVNRLIFDCRFVYLFWLVENKNP